MSLPLSGGFQVIDFDCLGLGPVTFSNSPVSLESELNAFSKDFPQFNVDSAESGIPKTTGQSKKKKRFV